MINNTGQSGYLKAMVGILAKASSKSLNLEIQMEKIKIFGSWNENQWIQYWKCLHNVFTWIQYWKCLHNGFTRIKKVAVSSSRLWRYKANGSTPAPNLPFFTCLRPPGATGLPALGRAARVTRVCRRSPTASRHHGVACLRDGRPRVTRACCEINPTSLYVTDLQFLQPPGAVRPLAFVAGCPT